MPKAMPKTVTAHPGAPGNPTCQALQATPVAVKSGSPLPPHLPPYRQAYSRWFGAEEDLVRAIILGQPQQMDLSDLVAILGRTPEAILNRARVLSSTAYQPPSFNHDADKVEMVLDRMLQNARPRHVKKGFSASTFMKGDLQPVREALTRGYCEYSDVPLVYKKGASFWPTLDRMDNRQGYTPDNVKVTARLVNLMRNDFPESDVRLVCQAVTMRHALTPSHAPGGSR